MSYQHIILIPLGGLGSRFKKNNYHYPKALINIFGRPLIYYLLQNLDINRETLVYIAYNHEYLKFRFETNLRSMFPGINFKFFHLLNNTQGAAETINLALRELTLPNDLPILCLDSDNFYTENIIKTWNHQNGVLYFQDQSPEPIFSYLELDSHSKLKDIREKEKISDYACCGGYGFNSYQQLLHFTNIILEENFKFKDEFYTSSCIKKMLQKEIEFIGIKVDKKNYHCLGTPIQLRQFYNNIPNISCLTGQQKNSRLRFCFDLDNTLVTYPQVPNDYSTVCPIESNIQFLKYLKNFGHTIIIHTARRMKTHQGNQGRVIADIGKITFETLDKFNIPYDEIYFGKPEADFYIDDRAVSAFGDLEKELGFYQDTIKPRDFNSVEKNTIEIFTKRSSDLSGEIFYYQHIPVSIKDMFPLFIDFDPQNTWYSIEKINGLNLSNMYLSELLTKNLLTHVMSSIRRIQSSPLPESDCDIDIYNNYAPKLTSRYENYDYSAYPNSEEVYQQLFSELSDYQHQQLGKKVCIHGDTVFTNILINQYDKLKFIDMRGQQGHQLTIEGDWLYDWAKMYQSLIGYDEILLNKEITINYKSQMVDHFQKIFIDWYSESDFSNLQLITNSLLFTLIPLHDNDKCYQYYNLIKM